MAVPGSLAFDARREPANRATQKGLVEQMTKLGFLRPTQLAMTFTSAITNRIGRMTHAAATSSANPTTR